MASHIYRCFRCGAQSTDPDQFVNQRALMSNAETAMPEDILCDDSADCDENLRILDELERDSRYLDQFTGPRPGGIRY